MADPSLSPPLTREGVKQAHELIQPLVHRTPVLSNATLTRLASTARSEADLEGTRWAGRTPARPTVRLWFKCENLQRIGAFKARGAIHAVERLKRDEGWVAGGGMKRGVVSHSSGNHAQALALAAREAGIPAYIVMPSISAPPKIAGTKGYGAKVIFSGSTAPKREAAAAKVIEETGATMVPPYDHPDIILGQGTAALELQEQAAQLIASAASSGAGGAQDLDERFAAPRDEVNGGKKTKGLDAIIAPCGGGGLLSGTALACEGTGISVFAAEPEFQGADDLRRGLERGSRVEAVSSLTVADGLRTPVGRLPWSVIHDRKLVRGAYSVTEEEIVAALRLVLERMKVVVEPSAVVPLAVVLFNEDFRAMVEREAGEEGWDLGVVFSGGNVALENLGSMFGSS